MTPLIWLASYPRSGNTWLRAFLAAYDRGTLPQWGDVDAWHAADRRLFYEAVGVESTDLPADEVRSLRPAVYRRIAAAARGSIVVKVHDAFDATPEGEPLFPADVTAAALYVVRNPLDVAVSWAHHARMDLDASVAFLGDPSAALGIGRGGPRPQLPQRLGTWSGHVTSWADQRVLPVHVVRYEDLLAQPVAAFAAVVRAAGRPLDDQRLGAAAEAVGFDRLRALEESEGFEERPYGVERFFRRGIAGGWRDSLTAAQVRRVIAAHADVMRRFGYLSADGEVTA